MQSVTLRAFAAAVLALLAVTSMANAEQEGVYTIPHYKFETGQEMDNVKIGYVTNGKLNADKSNAVLLVPGTSSGRHWADEYVGSGKMYDTDKYFFIGIDVIGGGNSTQPKEGLGMNFPRYTVRDMVHTEYHLLHEGLGLNGLLAVAGPSMGSFQGVEWGINYPTFMKGLILIVPAARSDQHFHSIVDAVIGLVTLDPAYKDGKYTENPVEGIKRSGMIPTIRGHLGGAAPLKGSAEEAFITDRIRPFLDSL